VISRFKANRHAWQALRASATLVNDAAAGSFARVEGRVVLDAEPVVSLLTGAECAIWKAVVQTRQFLAQSPTYATGFEPYWGIVLDRVTTTAFHLVDDAGSAIDVVADRAIVHLPPVPVDGETARLNDQDEALATLLRDNGAVPSAFMGITGDFKFLEACVRPGDRVWAFGKVEETGVVEATQYRDRVRTTKRIVGTDDARVIVSVLAQ
jgi:hypothetical protein